MENNPRINTENMINQIVESIKSKKCEIKELISSLKKKNNSTSEKYSEENWRIYIYYDSLIKLRLLIENNFNYLETLGILSTTRYIFELNIWLSLVNKNEKYSIVYCSILLNNQKRYYEDSLAQIEREISLFEEVNDLETVLIKEKVEYAKSVIDKEEKEELMRNVSSSAMSEIDSIVAKKFCTNFIEGQFNGYGYQAYLLKTNMIPKIRVSLCDIEKELTEFRNLLTEEQVEIIRRNSRWNWKNKAQEVDMVEEYEFIYSNTSRLLHATPVSITTNMKNLELEEMLVYLRYIEFSYKNTIKLTNKILNISAS